MAETIQAERQFRDIITYVTIPTHTRPEYSYRRGNAVQRTKTIPEHTVRVIWADTMLAVEDVHRIVHENKDRMIPGYDMIVVSPTGDAGPKPIYSKLSESYGRIHVHLVKFGNSSQQTHTCNAIIHAPEDFAYVPQNLRK